MSKNVIFCYSGTGNCLDMAKNIAKALGDTDIIMMRTEPVITDLTDVQRVGFVFPCYGGGAPADFLKYARLLKLRRGTYTFGVSLSSSYAGTGLAELNKIIPLSYWRTVTHQCSCIWLFPHRMMMPPMSPEKAQARSEKKARQIAAEIMVGIKTKKKPPKNPVNAMENKAWSKIAARKAKAFAVTDACIGCGQCEQVCPRNNIRMVNGRPQIGTNCIQCLGCLQYCPKEAIHMGGLTVKRERYHNPNVTANELTQDVFHY